MSGLLEQLVCIAPGGHEEEVLRCHLDEYVSRIEALSAESGGDAGELTPFGRSCEISCSPPGASSRRSTQSSTAQSTTCTR